MYIFLFVLELNILTSICPVDRNVITTCGNMSSAVTEVSITIKEKTTPHVDDGHDHSAHAQGRDVASGNRVASGNDMRDIDKGSEFTEDDTFEDDDLDEYDPDLTITEEDRKAWAYMLSKKQNELVTQKADFESWKEALACRRKLALSRMRKIGSFHKDRTSFYRTVRKYICELDQKRCINPDAHVNNSEQQCPDEKHPQNDNTPDIGHNPSATNENGLAAIKSVSWDTSIAEDTHTS
jgi:hypothetical protein